MAILVFIEKYPQVVGTLIIGFFTIIITLIYSWKNYTLSHQKMEKELFIEFNKRYDELNESLSKLHEIDTIDLLKNSELSNEKTMHQVLIDYFNLCSEQYYWKKKKRISKDIWYAWHAGMNYYYMNFSVVRELWESEISNEGYKSYYLNEGECFFRNIKRRKWHDL